MIVENFQKRLFHKAPIPKTKGKRLKVVPNGLEEIKEVYGNPSAVGNGKFDEAFRQHLDIFYLPFPMRLSWNKEKKVDKILAHSKIGDVIVDALKEAEAKVGYDYIRQHDYDLYGGVFNFRYKRGGSELSTHSWGIAIDLCPHIGGMGEDPSNFPSFYVKAFKKRGFIWGGDFNRPDAMHFQACKDY